MFRCALSGRYQKFPMQAEEIQTLMEQGINETRTLHNVSMVREDVVLPRRLTGGSKL